jgi:glycosyltransferase involved in cell wall biosynthesis
MKVLHFISGDLWAGAEAMAYQLLREQQTDPGLQVSAFILNDGVLAKKLRNASISIDVHDEHHSSFLTLLSAVRSSVARNRPDIIHSHRLKENVLAYLASRGKRKIRLVATQHGLPEAHQRNMLCRAGLVASLNRTILRNRFDRVVGVSAAIREHFVSSWRFPQERIAVIHNGIELPISAPKEVGGSELRIGSAGRLFAVKDYPLMVEIANGVVRKNPDIRFELVGEGPERDRIEQRVQQHRLETVFSMPGHSDDISSFYSKIDVYLNSSEHEGIPMSILEAMAYGLPVVAPKVGGIAEIIEDGVDGFLVSGREPEAFVGPILQLQDADLRLRIGRAARNKIEQSFSSEQMADQYSTLYRHVLI